MILKSQLEKIILEEAEKVLFERMVRRAIVHSLTEEQIRTIRETGDIPEELIEGVMGDIGKLAKSAGFSLTLAAISAMPNIAQAADIISQDRPPITAAAAADVRDTFDDVFMGQKVSAAMTILPALQTSMNNEKKEQIKLQQSPEKAEAYASFWEEIGSPGFASREEAKEYYINTIGPAYAKNIEDAKDGGRILNTVQHINKIPDNILQHFISNQNVGGIYDRETDAIYLNPHSYALTGETKYDEMTGEELIHLNAEGPKTSQLGFLLPSEADKPYGAMTGAGGKMFLRLLKSKDVLEDDWKSYVAAPTDDAAAGELFAKLGLLKAELISQDFFDASGKIDVNKLRDLLNHPENYKLDIDEFDERVLDAIDPDADDDSLRTLFDSLIAKAETGSEKRAMV